MFTFVFRIICHIEDELWDELEYERAYGSWKTNGLGHRVGQVMGETGVIVPGRKVKKIKRRKVQAARELIVDDDGTERLGEGQIQAKFEALCTSQFASLRPSGVTLDFSL